MNFSVVVGVFLFVMLFSGGCLAQTIPPELMQCEEYRAESMPSTHCDATHMNVPVWTAPGAGITQEFLYAQLLEPQPPLDISILEPVIFMDFECAAIYMRLFCNVVFQPCVELGGFAVPLQPCRSMCEDANNACVNFLVSNGIPPLDCSTYASQAEDPTCVVSPREQSLENFEYECPEPLEWAADEGGDPNTGLPCSMTCVTEHTLPADDWYETLRDMYKITSMISFVLLIPVLITYAVFPETREWPRRIVIFIGIGMLLLHLQGISNLWVSTEELVCVDGQITPPRNQNIYGWCMYSRMMFYWAAIFTPYWWMIQALVLFWNVGLSRNPRDLAKYEWIFHVFGWGFSTLIMILTMSLYEDKPLTGNPYCFATSPEWWSYAWLHAWYLLELLVVVSLVTVCIVRLAKESSLDQTFWRRWKYQTQMLIFTAIFFLSTLSFIMLRFWATVNEDDVTESLAGWYLCVYAGGGSDCGLDVYLSKGLYFFQNFWLGTMGTWLFVVFLLLNTYNRNLWRLGFLNIRSGRNFFHNPTQSTASGSKGTTSGGSSGGGGHSQDERRNLRREMREDKPAV